MKSIYKWLEARNAFSGIVGSVIFPLIFVPLFVWCTRYVQKHENQVEEKICVSVPKELLDYSFYVRYVREGPGGWRGEGPLLKDDLPLNDIGVRNPDQSRTRCQIISYTIHYGAQFKPFVDLNGKTSLRADQVRDILENAHYDLRYDREADQENFLFFLFPKGRYIQVPDYPATSAFGSSHVIYNNFINW